MTGFVRQAQLCIVAALEVNVLLCRDSGALKAMRKGGQAHSSTSAISGLPRSPVLATPTRFGRQYRGLGAGARAVLDAARRDEKLTGPERDIAVSHLDGDLSADNPGRTRRLPKWPVPAELALELHDPGIVTN